MASTHVSDSRSAFFNSELRIDRHKISCSNVASKYVRVLCGARPSCCSQGSLNRRLRQARSAFLPAAPRRTPAPAPPPARGGGGESSGWASRLGRLAAGEGAGEVARGASGSCAAAHFKGWNSQAHREFPAMFESKNLIRDNLSGEIGRAPAFFVQGSIY